MAGFRCISMRLHLPLQHSPCTCGGVQVQPLVELLSQPDRGHDDKQPVVPLRVPSTHLPQARAPHP